MEAPDAAPALPRLADLGGAQARAAGCLVGAVAGASLGLSVEPERHFRITRLFPEGLLDPWRFTAAGAATRRAPGDAAAAAAAAAALAGAGGAPALGPLLDALAASYAPRDFAYSPYTALVLDALSAGVDPFSLARQADAFLDAATSRSASTSSDRAERQPFGAADFGAALRCVPLGLVAKGASDKELTAAVDAWALFSHPQDDGRDGALAAAAAVAYLAGCDGPGGATPEGLLLRVRQVATSQAMTSKLDLLHRSLAALGQLPRVDGPAPLRRSSSSGGGGASSSGASGGGGEGGPAVGSWREFWRSAEWGRMVETHNLLTRHGFATLGTQAVAVALWALVTNWSRPQQAVVIAASLGGSSSTTAALTGAFAGALHGSAWLPERWWDALGESGAERRVRDGALEAALRLADMRLPSGGGAAAQ
ncbi:MAG: ADP-ribosylation/Crystallin J1 [Monoraphidium minutum]|nr:MAG: ADP-ribosylation/Crystallin J1 [Monoraphidium minutum]